MIFIFYSIPSSDDERGFNQYEEEVNQPGTSVHRRVHRHNVPTYGSSFSNLKSHSGKKKCRRYQNGNILLLRYCFDVEDLSFFCTTIHLEPKLKTPARGSKCNAAASLDLQFIVGFESLEQSHIIHSETEVNAIHKGILDLNLLSTGFESNC